MPRRLAPQHAHHRLHRLRIRDIRCDHIGAPGAQRIQLIRDPLRIRAGGADTGMIQHHARARRMKRARDLRADALRCAGDERGFSFQINPDVHAGRWMIFSAK